VTHWRSPGRRPGPSLPPQRRRPRAFPLIVVLAVLAAAIGLTVKLTASATPQCQASVVPAFFPPQDWGRASTGGRSPAVLILNPASGPGPAADPVFRPAIAEARGGGTDVIGYVDTNYAQRPLAQAERDVREYRDWYGVTSIFLDQTPTEGSAQLGYYRALARYIHAATADAVIWLNPGAYPDRSYMSVGNVVMAFEGPYENYLGLRVPAWARHYRSTRFAHTVYATPGPDVTDAVRLSRSRNAGYLYVTDDVGPNPYSALPDYWPREQAAVAGGCAAR
jgi:Spherulation-specific family 4